MKAQVRACIALVAAATASATVCGQTISYQYDELGRLKASSQSGGSKDGTATTISYDPAGNRSNYSVSGSGGTGGGSTGGGTTTNNPPVANADSLFVLEAQSDVVYVVANDTDPDGDYPLGITAISDPSGVAYIAS